MPDHNECSLRVLSALSKTFHWMVLIPDASPVDSSDANSTGSGPAMPDALALAAAGSLFLPLGLMLNAPRSQTRPEVPGGSTSDH